MILHPCNVPACNFDKTITAPIAVFEILVLIASVFILYYLWRKDKNVFKKYLVLAGGIFIFEFFTTTMWNNFHMGAWAYVYRDVSWILTIGWSTMIILAVHIINSLFPKLKAWGKFFLYLLLLTTVTIFFETLLVNMGIRSYGPEALAVINGHFIPLLNIPWQIFYYVPVFLSLVIGFYQYFSFSIDKKPLVPVNKSKLFRNFVIVFIGSLLFEVMVEPMIQNVGFPTWSYIYRDITIIFTLSYVLIIWIATTLIDKYFTHLHIAERFVGYLAVVALFTLPGESWLLHNGFRVYGQSAVENFSGINLPFLNLPVEIVFALPLFFALIIGFSRYWETILDNRL